MVANDSSVFIEVCAEDLATVQAAAAAGANGVELCAALSVGGLTPSSGMMRQARAVAGVELVVLVRPRPGDFLYDGQELRVMAADVGYARECGADGVALGVLRRDGSVDLEQTARFVEQARPMKVTFHRAFDLCRDPLLEAESLVQLGVDRILTSGQDADAAAGAGLLGELQQRLGDRLQVMAAGGIRPHNIRQLLQKTGVRYAHFSASKDGESAMEYRNHLLSLASGGGKSDEYRLPRVDDERIRQCVEQVAGI